MCINKIVKHLLTFVVVLFVVSCNQAPEQLLTPSTNEDVNSSVVNPVVVETIQDADKTHLQFRCLSVQNCYAPILLPTDVEFLYKAEFDQDGNLFIPIRTRIENKTNSAGFILTSKSSYEIVTTPIPELEWWEEIRQTIFSEGRMIFTIDGDQNVYILDESGNVREISFADMELYASYRIVKGGKGGIIVVGRSLKKQDNRIFIDINVINLLDNTVKTELIPWPESVDFENSQPPEAGMKYNAQIDGITSDRRLLYYQYFRLDDKMTFSWQLSVYNTQTGNDRDYQSAEGCIGLDFFKEYKGYLYKDGHKPIGESNLEVPLILDISDFRSIMDFEKFEKNSTVVRIVPFGDSFLVGFDKKIIQIDFSGKVLQEFPVPPDTVGGDYIIAQFED